MGCVGTGQTGRIFRTYATFYNLLLGGPHYFLFFSLCFLGNEKKWNGRKNLFPFDTRVYESRDGTIDAGIQKNKRGKNRIAAFDSGLFKALGFPPYRFVRRFGRHIQSFTLTRDGEGDREIQKSLISIPWPLSLCFSRTSRGQTSQTRQWLFRIIRCQEGKWNDSRYKLDTP